MATHPIKGMYVYVCIYLQKIVNTKEQFNLVGGGIRVEQSGEENDPLHNWR